MKDVIVKFQVGTVLGVPVYHYQTLAVSNVKTKKYENHISKQNRSQFQRMGKVYQNAKL